MKRSRRFFIVTFLGLLGASSVALAADCSLPPLPPIPAIGCREMIPECVCDSVGHCHWIFRCVKD